MLPNRLFTHKAYCHPKENAVYSVPDCVRGVLIIQYI